MASRLEQFFAEVGGWVVHLLGTSTGIRVVRAYGSVHAQAGLLPISLCVEFLFLYPRSVTSAPA
jgi:hypothetical protein